MGHNLGRESGHRLDRIDNPGYLLSAAELREFTRAPGVVRVSLFLDNYVDKFVLPTSQFISSAKERGRERGAGKGD